MAWPNIGERRKYVKQFVIGHHMNLHYSAKELQPIADMFDCSLSTIINDIRRLFERDECMCLSCVRGRLEAEAYGRIEKCYLRLIRRARQDGNCWTITIDGKSRYITTHVLGFAHRVAWAYHNKVDSIPPKMHVCHSCDNPSCINPLHLFLGTARDNHLDAVKKGRKRNGNWRRLP